MEAATVRECGRLHPRYFLTGDFLAGVVRIRRGSFFLAGGPVRGRGPALAAAALAESELASRARRLGAISL